MLYNAHWHFLKIWATSPYLCRTFQPVGAQEESKSDIQIRIPLVLAPFVQALRSMDFSVPSGEGCYALQNKSAPAGIFWNLSCTRPRSTRNVMADMTWQGSSFNTWVKIYYLPSKLLERMQNNQIVNSFWDIVLQTDTLLSSSDMLPQRDGTASS